MTAMNESQLEHSPADGARKREELQYCEQHGIMNKATDLKEKADQMAKQV
jgi:hypothetical protein